MRSNASRNFVFTIFQDLILLACIGLAGHLRYLLDAYPVFSAQKIGSFLVMFVVIKVCFYYFDIYEISLHISFREFFSNLLSSFIAVILILTVIYYFYPPAKAGDYMVSLIAPLSIFATILYRFLWNEFSKESSFTQRVVVLGTGRASQAVLEDVLRYSHSGYDVVGVIDEQKTDREDLLGFPILGYAKQLPNLFDEKPIDSIIVALDEQRGNLPTEELMGLKLAGVRIVDNVTFHELFSGKIILESLRPSWFVFTDGFKISRLRLFIKRVFDFLVALLGLILASPIILIIGLLIKLTSRGPILYRQERVGKGGRTFQLLKFRSMYTDAEARSGPVWAAMNDTRVTPVGRFIRRFRVDEIPQMWNVIAGSMSFVGPRPERPFFVKQLAAAIPYYHQRHVVKPGITGWAQVRYPYGASVEDSREKLQLDLYYIKHTNLGFDLKILFTTLRVLFKKMAR
ncbi:MAG: TIGR03013 family PEP-CTERM/XrtA system glycosyltransferase [Myxococcales bacterium]|nr:TIGR03013 family PEP-CTERM/XrtA system glycosyltransferase [Myxococcales bacterium]